MALRQAQRGGWSHKPHNEFSKWVPVNPAARVGETEGGHDFAVTADRFLVDPWLYHYYGESPVLDMDVPSDRAEAFARYGPEENWQRLPDVPGRAPRAPRTSATPRPSIG